MQKLDAKSRAEFEKLCADDAIVCACVGCSERMELSEVDALKLAITTLAVQRDALQTLLTESQGITPKRIRMPDGKIARWDAPDELVPIEDYGDDE